MRNRHSLWRLIAVISLSATRSTVAAEPIPALYQRIAEKYALPAERLYQHALTTSGHTSRYASQAQPWPWTAQLCPSCPRQTFPNRQALYAALRAAPNPNHTRIGAAGWRYDPTQVPSLWTATHPRVNLNLAARALAARAPATAHVPLIRSARAQRLTPLINRIAQTQGLDLTLVHAVIAAESAYDPNAVSSAGAVGLMQLMPATAAAYGLRPRERFDPVKNLQAGMRYLKHLQSRFPNQLDLVLAAYNAGETAVQRYGQIPPFKETRHYVAKVRRYLEHAGA